jgi:hypothetical protein
MSVSSLPDWSPATSSPTLAHISHTFQVLMSSIAYSRCTPAFSRTCSMACVNAANRTFISLPSVGLAGQIRAQLVVASPSDFQHVLHFWRDEAALHRIAPHPVAADDRPARRPCCSATGATAATPGMGLSTLFVVEAHSRNGQRGTSGRPLTPTGCRALPSRSPNSVLIRTYVGSSISPAA